MAFTKMLWKIGSVIGSWDYWTSVANTQLCKIWNYTFVKSNNKIAYYAVFFVDNGGTLGKVPLLISPDYDAATFWRSYGSTQVYTPQGSFTDANNITWYYCYATPLGASELVQPSDCVFNTQDNPYIYSNAGMEQAAQDLLDGIYAVPFHENYTVGQTYNLPATDIQKTIHKLYGTVLYRHITWFSSNNAYKAFSNNANAIITEVMRRITQKGDENGVAYVNIRVDNTAGDTFVGFDVFHGTTDEYGHNVSQINNLTANSKNTTYHYDYYAFKDSNDNYGIAYDWSDYVTIDDSGNIDYNTYVGDYRPFTVGIYPYTEYGLPVYETTNLGIDL